MSFPRMRPYPQQGSIAIANGDELHIPIGGSFLRVREADQAFKIVLDQDVELAAEENDVFRLKEGDKFKSITVFNNSGAVLTFQLEIGDGSVETNNISISGTIKTDDDETQTKLDALETTLTNIETDIAALETLLNSDENQRAGLTTLEGASYASVSNASSTVVSAVANTAGVIIRQGVVNGQGNSGSRGEILIGGNLLLSSHDSGTGTGVGYQVAQIHNFFVPAGNAVSINAATAASQAYIWYEVL